MSGISYGSSPVGSTPWMEAADVLFRKYATEVGGEYFKRGSGDKPKEGKVLTTVDNWTIVLHGRHSAVMRADYISVDGFEFKVAVKHWFHDFFGRILGSRDVDIGDQDLQKHYSVEASDEDKVRRLLGKQKFSTLWSRCATPGHGLRLRPNQVIGRFEAKRHKDGHEIIVDIRDPALMHGGALRRFCAIHDLLVETLRELADVGSASREHVEIPPLGENWEAVELT